MAIERPEDSFIELMELCFQAFQAASVKSWLAKVIYAHLGTKDLREVETWPQVTAGCFGAGSLLLSVSKYIGAIAACLEGQVDAICISGGSCLSWCWRRSRG